MKTEFKISVPRPCHEDWQSMKLENTGRFCDLCTKSVFDFTNKTPSEIQNYLKENVGKSVCGRFKNEQLNKFEIPIPKSILEQKMSFHKSFLLALFIVMGSTLFSCKNHNDDYVTGEPVVVEDTVQKQNQTLGMILPEKIEIKETDSIKNKVDTIPKK